MISVCQARSPVLYSPTAQTSLPLPVTALRLFVCVPTLGLEITFQQPTSPSFSFTTLKFLMAMLAGETLANEKSTAKKQTRFRAFTDV